MAEIFKRVTGAAYVHVFHHQVCADRHNADVNGLGTSPAYAASYVARSVSCFLFLAARHPADIDNVPYRWCPDTYHVIFDDMVSVPLRSSTALQSAVLAFFMLFLSESRGYRHVVVFLLDCICLRLELLLFAGRTVQVSSRRSTVASSAPTRSSNKASNGSLTYVTKLKRTRT